MQRIGCWFAKHSIMSASYQYFIKKPCLRCCKFMVLVLVSSWDYQWTILNAIMPFGWLSSSFLHIYRFIFFLCYSDSFVTLPFLTNRGNVVTLIVKSLKSPRSAVCKTAIMTSADILKVYSDHIIDSLDPMVCSFKPRLLVIFFSQWVSNILLPRLYLLCPFSSLMMLTGNFTFHLCFVFSLYNFFSSLHKISALSVRLLRELW